MAAASAIPLDVIQRLLPRPATASPPSAPTKLRLSDLEKIGVLGEGGFGAVFKVRHRETGAVYALKTALYDDGTAHVEARALRLGADSPHVVRCHATLRGDSGVFGILLEQMDAGSLSRVLRSRGGSGFPEPAVAEVAARCLAGLDLLQSRGVAHLDLKPGNLLADSRGHVKIADFGLSKILSGPDDSVKITSGTAAYMGPERFEHDAHASWRCAFAADVWSLGITVLELFSARRPVLPPGEMPTWGKLMRASRPHDAELPSLELEGFLNACLQTDPLCRATVRQLIRHPLVARRDVQRSSCALRKVIVDSIPP